MQYDESAVAELLGVPQKVFRNGRNEHVFTFEDATHVLLLWVFPDHSEVSVGLAPAQGGEQITHVKLRNVTRCEVAIDRDGARMARVHSADIPQAERGFVLEVRIHPRVQVTVTAA